MISPLLSSEGHFLFFSFQNPSSLTLFNSTYFHSFSSPIWNKESCHGNISGFIPVIKVKSLVGWPLETSWFPPSSHLLFLHYALTAGVIHVSASHLDLNCCRENCLYFFLFFFFFFFLWERLSLCTTAIWKYGCIIPHLYLICHPDLPADPSASSRICVCLFGSLRFIHEKHITSIKSIGALADVWLRCWHSWLNVGSELGGLMLLYAALELYGRSHAEAYSMYKVCWRLFILGIHSLLLSIHVKKGKKREQMWVTLQLIEPFVSAWAGVLLQHASVAADCFEASVPFIHKL